MRNRRGMIFVGVLIACVVLFTGVLAFHFFMREGRRSAYRSATNEHALVLARAGLELTQIHLARALSDPASPVRRRLLAPLGELTSGAEELGTVDLAASYPQLVERLARSLPRGKASVEALEAHFGIRASEVGPLPAVTIGGRTVERGDREKHGVLVVECTARVSTGGLFGTLSRTVRASYEFRVAAAPVTLLSDFTLFAQEHPTSGLANLRLQDGGTAKDKLSSYVSLEAMKQRGWLYVAPPASGAAWKPLLPVDFLPAPWVAPLGGLELSAVNLPDLAPQLARVACWNVPAGTAYAPFLEARGMLDGGRLDVGTTVRGTGALELPALTGVRRGGVLMASEITIGGAIPAPEHGALVLVATEGSIRVPAGVPVNAQLVALKGSVVLEGSPQVVGSVAAARLDLGGVAQGAQLAYDARFKDRAFGPGAGDNLIVDFARKPLAVE